MKLSELGEFGFIERFSKLFTQGLPRGVMGIGDDAAVFPVTDEKAMLVTTDMMVENEHFLLEKSAPEELGYKSLAVNLSDIAAMGGTPAYAFLSVGIPSSISVEWFDKFFMGLKELADETSTLLLGGDTSKADKLTINIVVIGKARVNHVKYRSNGQSGDILCLTDIVGDSAAGFKVLENDLPAGKDCQYLKMRHFMPRPQVEEGIWLARQPGVHAMIDVSDGVSSDVKHILKASGKGADLFIDDLPLSETMKNIANTYHWDIYEMALNGGEDYVLLFSVGRNYIDRVAKDYEAAFNKPFYQVGVLNDHTGKLNFVGSREGIDYQGGFDHFGF